MVDEQRLSAALRYDFQDSIWDSLMLLFSEDREAFYLLAVDGIGHCDNQWYVQMADLAAAVCLAIRESYSITLTEGSCNLVSFSGAVVRHIPDAIIKNVRDFLREIDGKTTAEPGTVGKDYVGTKISEAEVRFKLGE